MRIITLLLIMLSIGVAQAAKIYKCPGKVEKQYTYQEKPCKGSKVDEHTLNVVPVDEAKIAAAQAKLAAELEASKEKKEPAPVVLTLPTAAAPVTGNPQPVNNNAATTANPPTPANTSTANNSNAAKPTPVTPAPRPK